ncbi:MAG: nucleotidyl transferase AbiEii/AbiGii toxin family protein [Saccharospirillaceae bacterium]|nr:nucleotidyl transferase AbiEii/AbiGii toxin family protein [Saccharospirillaceae bacterium]
MKKIALMPKAKQAELFTLTAEKIGITPAAAEKDFWITWVLMVLFENKQLKKILRFKGGTSLSKCYQQIERFSEDIDLILDWNEVSSINPTNERSKTKQQKINKSINEQAQLYIKQSILPILEQDMQGICEATINTNDPHNIHITYPSSFKDQYLRPQVLLEIGPLAAMLPSEICEVTSYAAQYFPKVFKQKHIQVSTIKAERTFFEKLTILHAEAHRPATKKMPIRYARHYYDVYQMIKSGMANKALTQIDLLKDVVEFKKLFYPMNWAKYETATAQQIKLLPNNNHIKALEADYQSMQEMIFGPVPSFAELIKTLEQFELTMHQ